MANWATLMVTPAGEAPMEMCVAKRHADARLQIEALRVDPHDPQSRRQTALRCRHWKHSASSYSARLSGRHVVAGIAVLTFGAGGRPSIR